jgi:hypothetical protein
VSSSRSATSGFDDGAALALVVVLVDFDADVDVLGSLLVSSVVMFAK